MTRYLLAAAFALAFTIGAEARGQDHATLEQGEAVPSYYEPYAFLIGEWDLRGPDPSQRLIERFRWGPRQAYLWFSASFIQPDGSEHLHFEGPAIWNAQTGRLDYLFAVEPGSSSQERGDIRIDTEGSIIREVVLTDANGNQGVFRQTIRPEGAHRARVTVMRQTPTGWTPTFPGGDQLVMTRRAPSN